MVVVGAAPVVVAAPAAADQCDGSAARLLDEAEVIAVLDPRPAAVMEGLRALTAGRPAASCASSAISVPSDLLDLADWALQLPTGSPGKPDTVAPPALAGYSSPWLHLDDGRRAAVFTAPAGGVTTQGSHYPRTELREMTAAGAKAAWSNAPGAGTHTLMIRQAVTRLPPVRPQVVTAQILAGSDDMLQIRLEGTMLIARYGGSGKRVTLDAAYTLGTPYDLTITAGDGHVSVSYNGQQKSAEPIQGDGWYFKTGSYIQSNAASGEPADAVATVALYALHLIHTG